jgi:hypothetical protein
MNDNDNTSLQMLDELIDATENPHSIIMTFGYMEEFMKRAGIGIFRRKYIILKLKIQSLFWEKL